MPAPHYLTNPAHCKAMSSACIRLAAAICTALVWPMGCALGQPAGAFTSIGSMTTPRASHTATVILSGKVLITGGVQFTFPNDTLASAELYDPATGTFSATGSMTEPRVGHSATLLPDGRVLIAGGTTDLSAEIYDPSTGTFAATGNMVATPLSFGPKALATLLQDGRVFIPGSPTAQIYDPVSGTFAATAPYAAPPPVTA
jgi:hypothetical protein